MLGSRQRRNGISMIPTKYEKGKIILLSMSHLTTDAYGGMLMPLLPLLMETYHLTVSQAAILSSTLGFSSSFLQPFFGLVADKTRKTHLIMFGPLLAAVFLSSLNSASSFPGLLLLVFAGGLGIAAFHPVGAALTRLHSGINHHVGMSWFVTGGNIGYSTGSVLVTSLVALGGLQSIYVMMVPGLLLAFLLWRYIPEREFPARPRNAANHSHLTMRAALVIIMVIVIIRAFIIGGFSTFVPIFENQHGRSLVMGGVSLFLFLGIGAVGAFFGGNIAHKIGEKAIILLSFILPVPFLLLYVYLPSPLNLLSLSLGGLTLYASIPVVISVAQNIFIHRISTISSIVMGFCWGIGGLLVMPMGPVAETMGINNALVILALSAIIGLAAALILYTRNLSSVLLTSRPDGSHLHAT